MNDTIDDLDLERRLRDAFEVVMPLLDEVDDPGPRPVRATRTLYRRVVTAAACAAAVAVGIGGVALIGRDRPDSVTSEAPNTSAASAATTTTFGPTTSTPLAPTVAGGVAPIPAPEPASDRPSPWWDPVRVERGLVAWYQIDRSALAPDLADRLGPLHSWTAQYASQFYRCIDWTVETDGAVCRGLTGGSMVEPVWYGDGDEAEASVETGVSVGALLGDFDPAEVAWSLADGNLWGYGAFTSPPEPTEVDLVGGSGFVYRSDAGAYLAWQAAPGHVAWLRSPDWDDQSLAALAGAVRPVEFPERVPLLLSFDDVAQDGGPAGDRAQPFGAEELDLNLAFVDGQPCASFSMWTSCTPVGERPVLVVGAVLPNGLRPAVAAVAPAGMPIDLSVDLFEVGERELSSEVSRGGFDVVAFRSGPERLLSASVAATGAGDAQTVGFGVESILNGLRPDLVAEGRTTGYAWVVVRQDPSNPEVNPPPGRSSYGDGHYCWLLAQANGGFVPLCPPAETPESGLGAHADYAAELDMWEVASDVTDVSCAGESMPIVTDDEFADRRFVVVGCPNPQIVLDDGTSTTAG